ncbi:MAG TPA: monofunctional biosynthetic peptidoglycan transglycosylase [Spongiibacteraceae bacterium]|nr:monofunctional biosynthetic peptidoglycan transglycosylase [Spongiibacteraceae bacterium]
MKFLKKILLFVVGGALLLWLAGLLLFHFFTPPLTPTMIISAFENQRWIKHDTVSLNKISPYLQRAVIASEDGRFCVHNGIDFDAVQDAVEDYQEKGRLRGASTISMQVSRNVFLWTGGGAVRKVIEAPLALTLDAAWSKRHILEIYLNIAEWGPGVFGAEAAARYYFHKPASALSSFEAARLAAILPNPLRWNAARPTPYIVSRAVTIQARMSQLNHTQTRCVGL